MPKAAKRFASQHHRATSLSTNPETIQAHEINQSQVGFDAEAHHIKTKFQTRLTHTREALRVSTEYTNNSADDHECMEAQCMEMHEETKLKELESMGQVWLKIVKGNHVIQHESEIEEGNIDDEENVDQMLEDVEWNGIQDDMELDENEKDIEDNSSEGWEMEDDDGEEEEQEDESDDSFEDGDIDVSDIEVLYDKDGNVIVEEDIGEGLKEIMECHMSRLQRRFDMYTTLASLRDNDESGEEADGEEEAWGEIE